MQLPNLNKASTKLAVRVVLGLLIILQGFVVSVGKDYYVRFKKLEMENLEYDKEVENLQIHVAYLHDAIKKIEENLTLHNNMVFYRQLLQEHKNGRQD